MFETSQRHSRLCVHITEDGDRFLSRLICTFNIPRNMKTPNRYTRLIFFIYLVIFINHRSPFVHRADITERFYAID